MMSDTEVLEGLLDSLDTAWQDGRIEAFADSLSVRQMNLSEQTGGAFLRSLLPHQMELLTGDIFWRFLPNWN